MADRRSNVDSYAPLSMRPMSEILRDVRGGPETKGGHLNREIPIRGKTDPFVPSRTERGVDFPSQQDPLRLSLACPRMSHRLVFACRFKGLCDRRGWLASLTVWTCEATCRFSARVRRRSGTFDTAFDPHATFPSVCSCVPGLSTHVVSTFRPRTSAAGGGDRLKRRPGPRNRTRRRVRATARTRGFRLQVGRCASHGCDTLVFLACKTRASFPFAIPSVGERRRAQGSALPPASIPLSSIYRDHLPRSRYLSPPVGFAPLGPLPSVRDLDPSVPPRSRFPRMISISSFPPSVGLPPRVLPVSIEVSISLLPPAVFSSGPGGPAHERTVDTIG